MAVEGSPDPLFYNYPPLVFDLFAAAERALALLPGQPIGPASDVSPGAEYLAARLVSLAAFALAAVCVYAVAARSHGLPSGLLAGVAFAVAPLAVRQGHFATTDMISAAFAAGAMWLAAGKPIPRTALLAGVAVGLAVAAKYSAGVVLVYVLVMLARDRRALGLGVIAIAIAAVVFVALLLLTGRPLEYAKGLGFLASRASQTYPSAPIGFVFYPTRALPFGFGLGAAVLSAAGIVIGLWRRTRADVSALLMVLAGLLVLGPSHEVFYRYLLAVLPALAVLAGGVLRPGLGLDRRLVGAAAALLLLPSAYASVMTDRLLSVTDTREQAGAWLLANAPAGAGLKVDSYWSQPFYDVAEAEDRPLHPLYLTGDRVADSFEMGRYSDRFAVNAGGSPCYTYAASGPPGQAPMPDVASPVARFSPLAAGSDGRDAVYDELDSFYVPFWGFAGVERPGPSIAIAEGC
jgi:4-amino-4-deoxy-L-arabinose transferase-like glycosyltransferase